jgi:hypothetical protein
MESILEKKQIKKRKRIKVRAIRIYKWEEQKSTNHINQSNTSKSWQVSTK